MEEFITLRNECYEDEAALYSKTYDKIILRGDYYHDKIEEKIEGFLLGLQYAGFDVISTSEQINESSDLFKRCNFYVEEE